MNSPTIKTFLMMIAAAAVSGVAAYYYPWPEPIVESAKVGSPLFEEFDSGSVRRIRIFKFDVDKNNLDRMVVQRKGERWVLPSEKNYTAGNAQQIALTTNAFTDCLVLEEKTDRQEDYVKYGVVDPQEIAENTNRTSLGTKLVLEDRTDKKLAELIIGRPLKDDPSGRQRYVRIGGQPTVYVVELNPQVTATDFRAWIEPNLFQLGLGADLKAISIANYQIDPQELATGTTENRYRSRVSFDDNKIQLVKFEGADESGSWKELPITVERAAPFRELTAGIVQSPRGVIWPIFYLDVERKSPELAKALTTPSADAAEADFATLQKYGFAKVGFDADANGGSGSYEIRSVAGNVSVETNDAVVVTMHIGSIVEITSRGALQLGRNTMLTARVDQSLVPELEQPSDPEDKNYLRLLEERKNKLAVAAARAQELNQLYANWYYIVPESTIEKMRPELPAELLQVKTEPSVETP